MRLSGEFVLRKCGTEVCGCSFHDLVTLEKLIERYADGRIIKVIVESDEDTAKENHDSEDGAIGYSFSQSATSCESP